jgi:hypothetical protein
MITTYLWFISFTAELAGTWLNIGSHFMHINKWGHSRVLESKIYLICLGTRVANDLKPTGEAGCNFVSSGSRGRFFVDTRIRSP